MKFKDNSHSIYLSSIVMKNYVYAAMGNIVSYYNSHKPELEYPSCLHTTDASIVCHAELHTVPHTPS